MDTTSPSTTPPPAGCIYEREGDTAVVTLKPSLSDVKWDQIETLGNSIESKLNHDKPKKVVFDISPLTYMGSAMVALVVRWWKSVEKAGGKSVVVCQDENVLEVLRLASLDKHWTIRETREEAFTQLGSRASGGLMSSGTVSTDSNGDGSGTGPLLPLAAGGVALAVAIVGVVLYLIKVGAPMLGLGLTLGGGLTALVAGVLTFIVCEGKRKTAGVAVAFFGALLAGYCVYLLQANPAAPPAIESEAGETADAAVTPGTISSETGEQTLEEAVTPDGDTPPTRPAPAGTPSGTTPATTEGGPGTAEPVDAVGDEPAEAADGLGPAGPIDEENVSAPEDLPSGDNP